MTVIASPDEETIDALQKKVALLEQGMKQAANVRALWSKSVRELKATKVDLKKSLGELTAAHNELGHKNEALAELNAQLREEMELRERMEAELRLSQKLDSIGQLAAGVAHEINTPIQYVSDNTQFLSEAFGAFLKLYEHVGRLGDSTGDLPTPIVSAIELLETARLAELAEDVPDAIAETLEGLDEVADIVRSLKEFSHRGSQEKAPVDLNRALETTATVSRGEWKSVAEIEWQLAEGLPEVSAIGAELNQVFLNLLVNAVYAIAEAGKMKAGHAGLITIGTAEADGGVSITISDNGTGMPESIRQQVFDPFFTTKDVGEGSGQGLAIAHSIVVEHHAGKIAVSSEPGMGTTFELWIPAR